MIFYMMNTENVHYLGGAQVAYAMAVQVLIEFPLVLRITKILVKKPKIHYHEFKISSSGAIL